MNSKLLILSVIALTGAALFFVSQTSTTKTQVEDGLTIEAFSNFRITHQKNYVSAQELQYRYSVFSQNLAMIEKHNADSSQTYKLGVNSFSDLTYEEFKAKYLGHNNNLEGSAKCEKTGDDSMIYGEDKEVDWVKKGVVHAVKNQGQCGSCWAFATTAALESAYAIFKGEKGSDLAEQELVDCSTDYQNNGCGGGLMSFAYDYILDHGIHDSKDYPYKAVDQTCVADDTPGTVHHITGCRQVPKGVQNIVTAARKQPIAVAFYVQEDFFQYHSGVYNPKGCKSNPNHAVTVVGFKLDAKVPYLSVKNSWGNSWGLAGFFQIAIGTGNGTCNIGGHDWNYYPVV